MQDIHDELERWVAQRTAELMTANALLKKEIDEHKQAEQALLESNSLLRSVIEGTNDYIFAKDLNGRYLMVNSAAASFVGKPAEEIVGKNDMELFPPVIAQRLIEHDRQVIASGEMLTLEETLLFGGEPQATLVVKNVCRNDKGDVIGLIGISRNITERKQTEEELRRAEEKYHSIFENAVEGIYQSTPEGQFISVNPAHARMLGYDSAEEMIAELTDIEHQHYVEPGRRAEFKRLLAAHGVVQRFESEVYRRDGSKVWISENVRAVRDSNGKLLYYEGTVEDITERKQAEEALKQSERDYRGLFEQAHDAILVIDPEGERVLDINQRACKIYGFSREEFIGMSLESISKDVPRGRLRIQETLKKGDFLNFETVQYRKDGVEMFLEINAAVVNYKGQRTILSINRDITERKQVEEALRKSEAKFRAIFEKANIGIALVDMEGRCVQSNPALQEMLGYSEEELRTMPFSQYTYPDDLSANMVLFKRGMESGGASYQLEKRFIRKDGHLVWGNLIASTIPGYAGEPTYNLGMLEDITERKRAEEMQLRQTHQAALRAEISAILVESECPLQRILQKCAEAAVKHLGAAFARIWLLNTEKDVLELQASAGMYTHLDGAHSRVPVGTLKIGFIAQTRKPHLTNEIQSDPHISDPAWAERERIRAFAGYPLLVEQQLVGVIAIFARNPLAEDTLDALASVSDTIAQGIERKRIQEALRDSEDRYRDLVEHSQELICTHNLEGQIISVNSWAEKTLGYDVNDLLKKNIRDLLAPEFQGGFDKYLDTIQKEGFARGLMQVQTATGERRIWEYNNTLRTHGVAAPIVRGLARDITERKRADEALREIEARNHAILKALPDLMFLLTNNGFFLDYYAKNTDELLVPPEQFLGKNVRDVLPPELADKIVSCLQQLTDSSEPRVLEYPLHVGGEDCHYEARIVRCNSDEILCVVRDITHRKRGDAQRVQLMRRIITTQEEERQRIARELHDQMGQYLAALLLRVKSLKDDAQSAPHLIGSITKLQELINEFSQQTRRLALELRPPPLDDLGLSVAISNYLQQWSERNGIAVDFHSNGLLNKRFESSIETTLYRLIQEALTNVLKHSRAKHVSLVLEYRQGRMLMILDDDGCGFNIEATLNAPVTQRGLGLIGMQERLGSVGGTLDIESSPDMGTTIVARIPVLTLEGIDKD